MVTWSFIGHINGYRWHNLAERCIECPQIHRETLTHFRSDGITPTRSETGYFVVGDPNEFKTFEAANAALAAQLAQPTGREDG